MFKGDSSVKTLMKTSVQETSVGATLVRRLLLAGNCPGVNLTSRGTLVERSEGMVKRYLLAGNCPGVNCPGVN